ncbi:GNAT family N-acetyltransferase, partial [Planktotalea sp.]|uniref:GNAT family N-acetyltransferase n=1 Tax=Planktotalea sp. TaxID=2029877 RepID=UPI003297E339
KLGAILSEAVAANAWKPQLHTGAEDIAHMGDLIARGWVRVCETDGEVAGFIARNEQAIQSLYVQCAMQNNGVGAMLLNDAMGETQRLELWTFEANEGAQRFYLRHGFKEAERTNGAGNDEGLPDIRYVWDNPDKETNNG